MTTRSTSSSAARRAAAALSAGEVHARDQHGLVHLFQREAVADLGRFDRRLVFRCGPTLGERHVAGVAVHPVGLAGLVGGEIGDGLGPGIGRGVDRHEAADIGCRRSGWRRRPARCDVTWETQEAERRLGVEGRACAKHGRFRKLPVASGGCPKGDRQVVAAGQLEPQLGEAGGRGGAVPDRVGDGGVAGRHVGERAGRREVGRLARASPRRRH